MSRSWIVSRIKALSMITLFLYLVSANMPPTVKRAFKTNFSQNRQVLVGVLDSKRLRNEAVCFTAHDKIEKELEDMMRSVREEEINLKEKLHKIKQNGKTPKAKMEKQLNDVKNEWESLTSRYKQQMQNIQDKEVNTVKKINEGLVRAISRVASENKIDLVINTESQNSICVFFFSKNIDITDMVILRLNTELPSNKVLD